MDASFAYITSESLYVYGDYACGVEAVGKKNHIKCDGSYIDEVDGVDAAEWYAQMLGPDDLKKDASLSHIFPLVKRDEKGVAYYVDYLQWSIANNGEILYRLKAVSELKNGSSMSLGYFNPQNIFGQVKDLLHNVSENPAETIFAYDCHARNMILHNCAGWEIGNFNKTNISGALLSGEILSRNNENMYANYTFVLTALSEHEDSHFVLEPPDAASIRELQEDNVQMLNYLLVNANRRLNNEFQSQQDKMRDAVFYNASVGLDNQLKYRYDKERKGLDKTAIFSLNNEKMLRLFAGSTETYKLLKNCYSKVKKRFRVEGMYMYSYNDISLFIAANDKVSENKFSELVDEIHLFLNNSMYDEIQLSYTTVILFGQEDSMNRLEAALRYAINHKLSMIRFDEIGDDLKKEQEDVRLLWVVREALLHRRVTPYFQEIHDNTGGGKRMYESLMRVTDAEGKIYYPDEFLPVAKEYDLYESLSEMMVGEVIDMFRNKDVRVTINLNVQDIYNRNMLRMIFKNMQEVEHPENFVFEIVESEEIKDYEYIKGFADRIHEYGGRIAIDDFGSGFSNILHVLKIGADYIKVDGAVVRTISEEPRCRDFIEFMNDWCDKMGQKLICEYVENKEIQNIMEEIGVAFSQGYYFSKPHRWTEEDAV
jgi:EAL domain-containing protein (putative c-di-GMP-specific phosphodiesterase class I)